MANSAFQLGERHSAGHPSRISTRLTLFRLIAVACILLLAFTATVQVAHSHADDRASGHCQICFALHSAMPAEMVTAGLVFISIDPPAAELIHAAPLRFWISPFANGPPPLKSV